MEPPDTHHLSFALGWLELGNAAEARRELARLSASAARHPDTLEVRWTLAAGESDWCSARDVAEELVQAEPGRVSGWLHRAYAIRRVAGGGVAAAWDALLPAAAKFPQDPTVPYNLACYACQMGRLDEARGWLERTRRIGDKARIKKLALADHDLEPLWSEVDAW